MDTLEICQTMLDEAEMRNALGMENPSEDHEREVMEKRLGAGVPMCECHGPRLAKAFDPESDARVKAYVDSFTIISDTGPK